MSAAPAFLHVLHITHIVQVLPSPLSCSNLPQLQPFHYRTPPHTHNVGCGIT